MLLMSFIKGRDTMLISILVYCSSTESNLIKSLFRLFNGNFGMDVLNKMDVTKAYKCKVS